MTSFLRERKKYMDKIYTLGMDIGTTTTQLVICELVVENLTCSYLSVEPKVLSRQLIYQSPISITPMYDSYHLNETELMALFFKFIDESRVDIKQIKTGAVIITGESSLKENASTLIHGIADSTGEFIVATAGADLEAILAGCGSGVRDISYKQNEVLTNIDIGGGTTNIVNFSSGEAMDTLTLHIGGRLLKIDVQLKVTYLSPVLKKLLRSKDISIEEGDYITFLQITQIAGIMAEVIVSAIHPDEGQSQGFLYVSGQGALVKGERYFVSGGVGEYVYETVEEAQLLDACLEYEDIGPILGMEVKKAFEKKNWILSKPEERIRATVCGSGSHSMQFSGNTIYADEAILPLKNLPLLRVSYEGDTKTFIQTVKRLKAYHSGQTATYVTYRGDKSYNDIVNLAQAIAEMAEGFSEYILIVTDRNIGKALGQTLKRYVSKEQSIICIDHIQNTHGNYIDFGKKVGGTLPVVIKSLIF
jgi:ethanolamine utilization protein EutA